MSVLNSFMEMKSTDKNIEKVRPLRLKNWIQHYSWGMINTEAFIADLTGTQAKKDEPYAELWMGTHPNAPSQVIDLERGVIPLSEWINENPRKHLSLHRASMFPQGLPFLFKVLSAGEALSIQAHPNKEQAEALHQQDPEHYPDANHKPEIAIAIDSLDALVGLVSSAEYRQVLLDVPELQSLDLVYEPGLEVQSAVISILKLWEDDPPRVKTCMSSIYDRLSVSDIKNPSEQLYLDLAQIHGRDDLGLVFSFLLNRVQLRSGEAIFLPAGVPHAYLKGNIIECMANSDNVVRVGLTEKFCDTNALMEILSSAEYGDFNIDPIQTDTGMEYPTDTAEFRVKSLELADRSTQEFSAREDLSLFLVLKGEVNFHWCSGNESCCSVFHRGDSFIAPANLPAFSIQAKKQSSLFWVELP